MKRLLCALLASLVLAGCEQLRVASLPAGEVMACDAALAGWWEVRSEMPLEESDDTMHLHVSDDCSQWVTVETDRDGKRKREVASEKIRFEFRKLDDARYLGLSDIGEAGSQLDSVGEGYVLLRYVVRDDRVDLFDGDPRREAHRIAEGLVVGSVESQSHLGCGDHGRCAVNTTIKGDEHAIASWIRRFDPLDRAVFELRRVDDRTQKKLAADLKSPPTDGKPKPHE